MLHYFPPVGLLRNLNWRNTTSASDQSKAELPRYYVYMCTSVPLISFFDNTHQYTVFLDVTATTIALLLPEICSL